MKRVVAHSSDVTLRVMDSGGDYKTPPIMRPSKRSKETAGMLSKIISSGRCVVTAERRDFDPNSISIP